MPEREPESIPNPEPKEVFTGWQKVRCRVDGEEYICTPYSDYYNATGETDENGVFVGGVCEAHLLSEAGFEMLDTVEPAGPDMGFIGKKLAPEAESD